MHCLKISTDFLNICKVSCLDNTDTQTDPSYDFFIINLVNQNLIRWHFQITYQKHCLSVLFSKDNAIAKSLGAVGSLLVPASPLSTSLESGLEKIGID